MESKLEAALAYAAHGWRVFPLQVGGKVPLGTLAPHGHKDATLDEATILRWWTLSPNANIGIPTGLATFDALDLDCDIETGEDGCATLRGIRHYEPFPEGPTQRTPRGGSHVLFQGGVLRNFAKRLPGVDWRGEGGYIVVAPSCDPKGRPYEMLGMDLPLPKVPGWLMRALSTKAPPADPPVETTIVHFDDLDRLVELGFDATPIREGSRDESLFRNACRLQGIGMADDELAQAIRSANQGLCRPPLVDAQVLKIIRQACAYPKGDLLDWPEKEVKQAIKRRLEIRKRQAELERLATPEERDAAMVTVGEAFGLPISTLLATGEREESFALRLLSGEMVRIGNSKILCTQNLLRERIVGSGVKMTLPMVPQKAYHELISLLITHREIVEPDSDSQAERLGGAMLGYLEANQPVCEWVDRADVIKIRKPIRQNDDLLVHVGALRTFLRIDLRLDWTEGEIVDALRELGAKKERVTFGHAGVGGQAVYWRVFDFAR